jgi:transglutaminase-like putative cysteine protease
MKISQALNLFTHLVALIGFLGICITGYVGPISITIFVVSLGLSFINERSQKQYYLSQRIVTALAFVLLVYVFLSVVLLASDVFNVILSFLIYTQALKLLSRKDMRDFIQIYILSFFHFLAGTILTVDFSYGIAFIAYVSVALWAIMVFSMKKESIEASSKDDPELVTPLFLSSTVIISFGIFMFTAVIFVSVPRISSGFFASGFVKPQALKSGFSDEVKLGQVGEIKLDGSPVMRVKILNENPESFHESFYWRGIALDYFDGRTWKISEADYKIYKDNGEGMIRVKEESDNLLYQEIVTEPLDTDILFAVSLPIGFHGVPGGRLQEANDSYMLASRVSYRLKYAASSDLSAPSPEQLTKARVNYPISIARRYLQLPVLSDRIRELANQITSLDRTSYDKAASIRRYLVSNMNYTRTLQKGKSNFPVDDFLFENKAGHCEYFATAMVVLLREVGIPARIVNGFHGGEWNEYGRFFLIRESNAHSWVEVYFPEYGWVSFDPTPAGESELSASGSLFFLSSYVDYLRYRWSRYVVDFSQRDQFVLFQGIRSNWTWQKSKLESKVDFQLRDLGKRWLVALLLLVIVTWGVYTRSDLKCLFGYTGKKPEERASSIYKKALLLLAKKGFSKSEFLTPREFARIVTISRGRELKTFSEFTEHYLNLRFGGGYMTNELKELEDLWERLKKEDKQ